jgi:hypothetical protein
MFAIQMGDYLLVSHGHQLRGLEIFYKLQAKVMKAMMGENHIRVSLFAYCGHIRDRVKHRGGSRSGGFDVGG